jgi:hypothetical protein
LDEHIGPSVNFLWNFSHVCFYSYRSYSEGEGEQKPKLTKQDADSFFIGVKPDDKSPIGNSSYPDSITRLPYKKRECEISRDEYEIGMSF